MNLECAIVWFKYKPNFTILILQLMIDINLQMHCCYNLRITDRIEKDLYSIASLKLSY